MALRGSEISGDVYAWTAVLILPFNSALNPFLYTLTAIVGKKVSNYSIYIFFNCFDVGNNHLKQWLQVLWMTIFPCDFLKI